MVLFLGTSRSEFERAGALGIFDQERVGLQGLDDPADGRRLVGRARAAERALRPEDVGAEADVHRDRDAVALGRAQQRVLGGQHDVEFLLRIETLVEHLLLQPLRHDEAAVARRVDLDVGDAIVGDGLHLVRHQPREVLEEILPRRIDTVADAAAILRRSERDRARQRHLERAGRMLLQELDFVAGDPALRRAACPRPRDTCGTNSSRSATSLPTSVRIARRSRCRGPRSRGRICRRSRTARTRGGIRRRNRFRCRRRAASSARRGSPRPRSPSSSASSMRPCRRSMRALRSLSGRMRLPQWSARKIALCHG